MGLNELAKYVGDATYGFLAINFFWGLYNLVIGFRRVKELNFDTHEEQAEFLEEISQPIRDGRFKPVEELCQEDARALPQLVHLTIVNRDLAPDQLRHVVSEVVQRDVIGDLEYRANWIATVIKSGPLLGLFGTVLGMLAAFGRIGTGEKVQPFEIAHEISIALICTAMGLMTAIPFNYMLAALNSKIRAFQDALGAGLVRVLELLKARTARGD